MAYKIANRVQMTPSAAPGIGPVTLAAATPGFQSFAAGGVANGDTVPYLIEDDANWEIGVGTYSSTGPTLTRTTILASSNSGSAITASATSLIMVAPSAADLQATANLFWDIANSRLGLGTTSPAYKFELKDGVFGLTGTPALASYTTASGATATTRSSQLVASSYTAAAGDNAYASLLVNPAVNTNGIANSFVYGVHSIPKLATSSATEAATAVGFFGQAIRSSSTDLTNNANLYGGVFQAGHNNAADAAFSYTSPAAYAVQTSTNNNQGVITNQYGAYLTHNIAYTPGRTASATNAYGLFTLANVGATSGAGTGTLTNYYDAYLAGVTVRATGTVTNKYGVYQVATDHINFFGSQVRAPIFYDGDNTGYYVDPASTTLINTLQAGYVLSSADIRAYRSSATGTGVIYFSQTGDYYLYWDGSRFALNGGYTLATGSLRAPLFYDSDNTSYYVDPASTSNLVNLNVGGGATFVSSPTTSNAWFSTAAYGTSQGDNRTHFGYNTGSSYVNYIRGAWTYVDTPGTTFSTELRVPLIYDNDNTGYYVNPASASNFNQLNLITLINGTNFSGRPYATASQSVGSFLTASGSLGGFELQSGGSSHAAFMCFHRPGNWAAYFGIDTDNQFAVGGWSYGAALGNFKCNAIGVGGAASVSPGRVYAYGDMFSPVYYDYNNSGYYLDPASTSNIIAAVFSGYHTIDTSGGIFRTGGGNYGVRIYPGGGSSATLGVLQFTNAAQNVQWGSLYYNGAEGGVGTDTAVPFYIRTNGLTRLTVDGSGNATFTNSLNAPGSVLQVVQTVKTSTTSAAVSANTYNEFDSGFRVSITPKTTSNKVLVTACITGAQSTGTVRYKFQFSTNGGSTWSDVPYQGDANASHGQAHFGYAVNGDGNQVNTCVMELLHSPGTTSTITYRVLFGVDVGTTYHFNRSISYPNSFLGATYCSTFIAKEIGG